MRTFDFSRSYLRFRVDLSRAITLSHQPPTTVNNVRINVESTCELTELATGQRACFALGASCKTERVGGPGPLWLEPNADFCMALGDDQFLIIKRWAKCDMGVRRYPEHLGVQPERQSGRPGDAWTHWSVDLPEIEGRPLDDVDAIIDAIRGERPIVSRTEYEDAGYRVVLQHPVKTINFSDREMVYQTDTGPLALPNFSRRRETGLLIESLELAYSAFNCPDWAEFIVSVPTELVLGIKVNHYSRPRRIDGAKNTLLLVE